MRRGRKFTAKNRTARALAKLEQNIGYELLAKEAIKGLDTPVSIHVHSRRKRLLDVDNISAKAAIDGIVLTGLLPADTPEIVKDVTHSQEKSKIEETIISIYRAE